MCLTLVSGYNTQLRHAIIKRWLELEQECAGSTALPIPAGQFSQLQQQVQSLQAELQGYKRQQLETEMGKDFLRYCTPEIKHCFSINDSNAYFFYFMKHNIAPIRSPLQLEDLFVRYCTLHGITCVPLKQSGKRRLILTRADPAEEVLQIATPEQHPAQVEF